MHTQLFLCYVYVFAASQPLAFAPTFISIHPDSSTRRIHFTQPATISLGHHSSILFKVSCFHKEFSATKVRICKQVHVCACVLHFVRACVYVFLYCVFACSDMSMCVRELVCMRVCVLVGVFE